MKKKYCFSFIFQVHDYVLKYATKDAVDALGQESGLESSISSFSDDDAASAMDI